MASFAAPAAPIVAPLTQSDGTAFDARARGDEWYNWMETADGYAIVRSGADWHYAQLSADGGLEASSLRVVAGKAPAAAAFAKDLHPAGANKNARNESVSKVLPRPGLVNQELVCVLVSFSDTTFNYPESEFESLIFGTGQSVRSFYLEASYNEFNVTPAAELSGAVNNGVVAVTLNYAHPNFGNTFSSAKQVVADAMTAADPFINYAMFDTNGDGAVSAQELSFLMVIAGYENSYGGASSKTPRIWAHQGGITAITLDGVQLSSYAMFGERHATTSSADHRATVGIMAHELGHLMFALPDLYDTDYSSNGVGNWCLMGLGSWNRTGSFIGDSPSQLSAWSKTSIAFVTPETVSSPQAGVLLPSVTDNPLIKRLWIDKYREHEYFLVEHRNRTSFDTGLPGEGVLIWHVDETRPSNANENRKLVDLEEADGLRHIDLLTNAGDGGDPYPGSSDNHLFADATNPNSRDYASASTGVSVGGLTTSGLSISADLTPGSIAFGSALGYDDGGVFGYIVGYNNNTVWTAMRFTNGPSAKRIDGCEVYTLAAGTVDAYLYTSIPGGVPTDQLLSKTANSVQAGWNRIFFTNPENFPASQDRVLVLRIQLPGQAYPAAYDPFGVNEGRAYVSSNGTGAYFQLTGTWGDLNQRLLLSPVPSQGWIVR